MLLTLDTGENHYPTFSPKPVALVLTLAAKVTNGKQVPNNRFGNSGLKVNTTTPAPDSIATAAARSHIPSGIGEFVCYLADVLAMLVPGA